MSANRLQLRKTWVRAHAAISAHLSESNASREEKRRAARAALLSDYADDFARAASAAGLDSLQLEEWLAISEDGIAAMPANGRIQEVIHQRIRDSQHRWHDNDLSDVYFLASAAGYADFLLAENETSHDLGLAERRVPSGARICSSPAELTDLIEGLAITAPPGQEMGQGAPQIPADPSRARFARKPL